MSLNHIIHITYLSLVLGHIRVERLRSKTTTSTMRPTGDGANNNGANGNAGANNDDVFCWEGNLNAILGPSSVSVPFDHTREFITSISPFGQVSKNHATKSSSSSLLDHPSSIVIPERVRAYVLIAQRGLGRCLQELHATASSQQPRQGSKQDFASKSWQPIVLVESL